MDILRIGTAAIAAGGMVLIGMGMHSGTQPTAVTAVQALPAPAPSAYDCAVHCEVHLDDIGVEPLSLPPLASGRDIGAPVVPPVVTVYLPAPSTATPTPEPVSGPSVASKPAKASRGSTSIASKPAKSNSAKAPAQPKGPTTTVTDKTVTGPKGTTTTHTTTTKGLPVSAGRQLRPPAGKNPSSPSRA